MEETTKAAYRDLLNDATSAQRAGYASLYAMRVAEAKGPLDAPLEDRTLETLLEHEVGRRTVRRKQYSHWFFFTKNQYELATMGRVELHEQRKDVRLALGLATAAEIDDKDNAMREAGYQPHDIAMRAMILNGEFDDAPASFFTEPKLGTRVAKRLKNRKEYSSRRTSSNAADDDIFWAAMYAGSSDSGSSGSGFGSSNEFVGGGGTFGGAGASATWEPHTPSSYVEPAHHNYDSHSSYSSHHDTSSSHDSSPSCSSGDSGGSSCGGGGCGGGGD